MVVQGEIKERYFEKVYKGNFSEERGSERKMNVKLSLLGIGLVALTLSIWNWTPVVIISTHPDNMTYSSSWPEIAIDASGNSYITWYGFDGNDKDIYWVKIDASGAPGTVQKISDHPDNVDNDDWYPQIAVDSGGNSYVAWHCFHGGGCDIYWVKIDTSGAPGIVQKISDHPGCTGCGGWHPQIAVDSGGNSFITWYGSEGNDSDIYWVKIDTSATPGEVQRISTHPDNVEYYDVDPQIAVDLSGNSYVVWHGCSRENCREEPGDFEIYWVKIDPSGVPGEVLKIRPAFPDYINTEDGEPQIAVDARGNSFVVWSGLNENNYDIYWIRIDASGAPGEAQKTSTQSGDVDFDDQYPQIIADAVGNLCITWESSDEDDIDIFWVKIDASGTFGKVRKISNYLQSTTFIDSGPSIALDESGNSYVTWTSYNRGIAEQFDQRVWWVKIDPSGNPGRAQKVPSHPDSDHFDWRPQIAVDAGGTSYVTWQGEDVSDNSHVYFTAHIPNPASKTMVGAAVIIVLALIIVLAVIMARRRTG